MKISWTDVAIDDLLEIREHWQAESKEYSAQLTKGIRAAVATLKDWPHQKGTYIKELEDLSLSQYRQILYEKYRIIFERVESQDTFVIHIVCHTSRNLESLLRRRHLANHT
ncbi:MAG TPA: type II toxin-antitoxin system RelE/ParE family toxin [Duganella sp.]|jgi:plasmid stabilization system protein ParE